MSQAPHTKDLKTHFVSGEPGTTGREPFEDSISKNLHSGLGGGNHATGGDHSTGGITGQLANTGISGQGQQHANTGAREQYSGVGAPGQTSGVGIPGDHNTHSHSHGLVGSDSHNHANTGTAGTHDNSHGSHDSHGEKKGIAEKVKEALPVGGSSSHHTGDRTSNAHSSTTNTHPDANSSHTGATYDRSVVDKVNDALPGTPAKASQNYGAHASNQADHQVGAGTAYGAGKHGTDHQSAGLAGIGAGVGGAAVGAGHHGPDSTHQHGLDSTHQHGLGASHQHGSDSAHQHGSDSTHQHHHNSAQSGVTGAPLAGASAVGAHKAHDGRVGSDNAFDRVQQDTSQRAPGEKSGGIGGILGTSDKDFTGRERQGKGAYADTDGKFELNTSGPAGNTALTGREGTTESNPVARAQSHATGTDAHPTSTTTGAHDAHASETGEKKGLLQKVKDAIL